MLPKIYIISLKREIARKIQLMINLKKKSFEYEVFDAIDLRDFTKDEILAKVDEERRGWTNYLRPGAVCCALSHMGAYQMFLETKDEHCIILEDDTYPVVDSDFLSGFFTSIPSQCLPDILLMFSHSNEKIRLYSTDTSYEKYEIFICKESFPAGACAYLINRKAAQRILSYNFPVKATADQWNEFAKPDLRIGVVKPDLFADALLESTLEYLPQRMIWAKHFVPRWARTLRKKISYSKRAKNIKFEIH